MSKWLIDSSLKVNKNKTEVCLFCKRDTHPVTVTLNCTRMVMGMWIVVTLQPDLETVEREPKVLYFKRVDIHANPSMLNLMVKSWVVYAY